MNDVTGYKKPVPPAPWNERKPKLLVEKLYTLLDAIREVETSETESEAIDVVARRVADFGYPNVMISLLFEEEKPCVVKAVRARGAEWERILPMTVRRYPGPDLLAQVLERGESKYIPDSRVDPENNAKAIKESGIISQYVVPLMTREKKIGTMQVHFGECSPQPELQCKVLDALGAHLSLAISRFRTLTELRDADAHIMEFGKLAIGNEVGAAMMHQLKAEISKFQSELTEMLSQKRYKENPLAKVVLEKLKRDVAEWRKKVEKPLAFMVPKEELKNCRVADVVQETIAFWYADALTRKCQIKFRQYAPQIFVHIRPSHLKETLSCLVVNALQAHARTVEITLDQGLEETGAAEETCAILRVADDGEGISEDIVKDIFRLGFTTKRQGGTGIGLFIVKRLTDAMSGSIFLESGRRPAGKFNTVFKLVIPGKIR